MRVTVRDTEALRALNPIDILSYLDAQGWQRLSVSNKRVVCLLDKPNSGDFEVVVPLDNTFRDYMIRVAELLHTLEQAEARSQLELLKDITTSSVDLMRIEPDIETWPDGSVGIEQGNALVQQTRDMLLAAACATVKPSKMYPNRKPQEAIEYMRKARLGQTEKGSFVLTILSPVNPYLSSQLKLFPDEIPFERRVMEMLFRALVAVREASIAGMTEHSFEPFGVAVENGVSANLCEALVGLYNQADIKSLTFKMTWARTRQRNPNAISLAQITKDIIPIVDEGGRWLRQTAPRENTTVAGMPYVLEHRYGEGHQIIVSTVIDSKPRKVHIDLSEAEYAKAMDANKNERMIKCDGVLTRDGRRFTLTQPSPIELIEESDEV